jgi:hypothetical protein
MKHAQVGTELEGGIDDLGKLVPMIHTQKAQKTERQWWWWA